MIIDKKRWVELGFVTVNMNECPKFKAITAQWIKTHVGSVKTCMF